MNCNDISLRIYNTFGINAKARKIIIVETITGLCQAWDESQKKELPLLILGESSNVLLTEDFCGIVAINRLKGITVAEDKDFWCLHVGAGENWHKLVEFSLNKGIFGLENLASIPGCAGTAPIQNIGAYGVEFKQVCDYVDFIDLKTRDITRIDVTECHFGYRDSVFKHKYRNGFAIIAIGLRLCKRWQPVISYGDLKKLDPSIVTPIAIFDTVCQIRRDKLPDPVNMGNAGSFFKNPLLSAEQGAKIINGFPQMTYYKQDNGHIKLPAGWLIEQCDLKGYCQGGAAVHAKQALVIVNQERATGHDIVSLARHIRHCVGEKFGIWLEPEVRFIGAMGEKDAVEAITR